MKIGFSISAHQTVESTYCIIRKIDITSIERSLRQFSLFASPALTVDEIVDPMADNMSCELDKAAPVEADRKLVVTRSNRGKQNRIENRWMTTRSETNGVVFCRCCRTANTLINKTLAAISFDDGLWECNISLAINGNS